MTNKRQLEKRYTELVDQIHKVEFSQLPALLQVYSKIIQSKNHQLVQKILASIINLSSCEISDPAVLCVVVPTLQSIISRNSIENLNSLLELKDYAI